MCLCFVGESNSEQNNSEIIDVVDTTNKEQHNFQADAQQILKLCRPTQSIQIAKYFFANR